MAVPLLKSPLRRPKRNHEATSFDRWYARFHGQNLDEESRERGNKVLQVVHALPLMQPAILVLGCGTRWFSEKLAGYGKITALEIFTDEILTTKPRRTAVQDIAEVFQEMGFSPSHFDIALCVEMIAHVPDKVRFLADLASVIKPEGHLIVTCVNTTSSQQRSYGGHPGLGHAGQWLSRREINRLLDPEFRVLRHITVFPKGERGVMQVINSCRVNWALQCIFPERTITWAKEKLGFGKYRVILAERRGS
jgi:SAM-dependent methyltransferase